MCNTRSSSIRLEQRSISQAGVLCHCLSVIICPGVPPLLHRETGNIYLRREGRHNVGILCDHFSFRSQHITQTLIQCMGNYFVIYGSFFFVVVTKSGMHTILSELFARLPFFSPLHYCRQTLISPHEGSRNDHQPVYMCWHGSRSACGYVGITYTLHE